jgi:hypothetical protein
MPCTASSILAGKAAKHRGLVDATYGMGNCTIPDCGFLAVLPECVGVSHLVDASDCRSQSCDKFTMPNSLSLQGHRGIFNSSTALPLNAKPLEQYGATIVKMSIIFAFNTMFKPQLVQAVDCSIGLGAQRYRGLFSDSVFGEYPVDEYVPSIPGLGV